MKLEMGVRGNKMTEEQYICASNRVKVTHAKNLIKDVLPGENYGISENVHKTLLKALSTCERVLFDSYEITNEER